MKKTLIFSLFILVLLLFGCSNKTPIPDEVKKAHEKLQNLRAAIQTGVSVIQYNTMVIEAQSAVNMAEPLLPYTVVTVEPEEKHFYNKADLIPSKISYRMQKAINAFSDAGIIWRYKLKGDILIETEESKLIKTRNNIGSTEMNIDKIRDLIWVVATRQTSELQQLIQQ